MIYSKAALQRFLGKGLERLLCSGALFFREVKDGQCISRNPGLMVRTVHHLTVKWDLGVSMWVKEKNPVNQEHLGKDSTATGTDGLLTEPKMRLYSKIIARKKRIDP